MVSEEITIIETKKGVKENSFNMFLPLVSMILIMPIMLFYTGYDESLQNKTFFNIIGNASGSSSVLYSVLIALIISSIYYFINKIMTVREIIDNTIKGMSGMISLALLIILAFAIGNLCNELGTGAYVSESLKDVLSPKLVPVLLFLTSCFIAFSTGTSWGTFAIMIAIAVPISNQMEVDSSIAIAAALGGGLFGDHCSPISDTSVISSMASASDHIDHVKTQIPYALISGIITSVLYLIIGFVS
jgi:Na+/H+ antiporter NhaC